MTILGHLMRYGRTRAAMTQEQVAEALGVSRSTVNKLEMGELPGHRTQMIRALGRLYGIDWAVVGMAMDCDDQGLSAADSSSALWDLAYEQLSPEQRSDIISMALCCAQPQPLPTPPPEGPEWDPSEVEVEEDVMGIITEPDDGAVLILSDGTKLESTPETESEDPWFNPHP